MDNVQIEKIDKLPDNIHPTKIYNINVGILGHIDSGKTSLAKALSTVSSTASFDKNPQSQERGITLDLGFSAFYIKTPQYIKEKYNNVERLKDSEFIQVTLVDCPGHASLIRTVVAGASIIDSIILVIDLVKGIQIQTTECLILGEILVDKMIVALNKVDTIPKETRWSTLEPKIAKLRLGLAQTKFGKDVPIVSVAADPSNPIFNIENGENLNELLLNLIQSIVDSIDFNKRKYKEKLIFSVDHCFNIKNKGTVVTGTILQGKISINDEIYFPSLSEKKIVKEIQMFRKNTQIAFQGDRVGLLIKNLDSSKV